MGINEKAWHVGFKWTIKDEDNPTGAICLDNASKALHICDIEDAATDWDVSTTSHPTLYIHSASDPATDFISMYHDGTSGIITLDGTTIFTLTATTLAISVDTSISGDLDLLTEDISVTTGKYIYLDGASGNDYLRCATDGNVVLNGATTVKVAIGGTTEVEVSSAAVTLATNNLTLTAGHISVAATKYIYLDGQSGSEYVRAVTDGNAILNGATTSALGIAGTAIISCASATATFSQKIVQDDTTTSSSTATGSIQTDGGLGVAGTSFFGETVDIGVSTSHNINISGKWGTGITGAAISIGDYSNALVFGAVSEHVIGIVCHVSASFDDSSNAIPILGKVTLTNDSTSAIAQCILGQGVCSYNIADMYGVRGSIAISGAPEVNQIFSMFGSMDTTACNVASTGAIALFGGTITGSADITRAGATAVMCGMYLNWNVTTVSMTIPVYGIMVNIREAAYVDYGIIVHGGYCNEAAFCSSGTSHPVAFEILDAHDFAFKFPTEGTSPCSAHVVDENTTGRIKVKVGGSTRYLYYYD